MARLHRGEKYSHWCRKCALATEPNKEDRITRRLYVKRSNIHNLKGSDSSQTPLLDLVKIELVGIGSILSEKILIEPDLIHSLSPDQFEEFICDRLYAMGFEPKRIGNIFQSDGGIDVVFWPRNRSSFPFLGAAQVKHHRNPARKEGVSTVREFIGSIGGHPFSAGIIVTNTSFSANAEWFAKQKSGLIRLRGFQDICRWIENNFSSEEEWREFPKSITLAPGLTINIR